MTIEIIRPASVGFLGLAILLGACVAPAPAPIELTVTVHEAGTCCQAGNLVTCRDRTAAIKEAFADPDNLHHTVPELGASDFDRPSTAEHDRGGTVERDRGDTVEHDLLRCKFRNRQLYEALVECHQLLNECRAASHANGAACTSAYQACYNAAVTAGPFDNP